MNNQTAQDLIDECENDLERIEKIIEVLTSTNPAVPFLSKYSIIKTCGTLEQCFKIIISDFCSQNQNQQIRNYIDITFRESSINPSIDNIHKSLCRFDSNWNETFKNLLKCDSNKDRIKLSISSLNNARNQFAHGGNPGITFNDVKDYFEDAKTVISYLDQSVI
ncbi:HEPN domain-containing protein [Flavobacterium gelatinilyticum]|uniref:HEPN domain-containing protein n=1 Tax=Flavobacterium gelatinilyticum TaxID=3003260 RepID=UPI002480AF71|nr:HEPN domain-containing protein [Flavobacterium gelatinilyticum]